MILAGENPEEMAAKIARVENGPQLPRWPASPFAFYLLDHMNRDEIELTARIHDLRDMYKNLPEDQKNVYIQKANFDKKRYAREMEEYMFQKWTFWKSIRTTNVSNIKKYLTPDLFERMKKLKSSAGRTILDLAELGILNCHSGIGIFAHDADSYSVFAELFNPVIEDYHKGFNPRSRQPRLSYGDPEEIRNLDPKSEYVISTCVSCLRNCECYPFSPCLTETQYGEIEQLVLSTLSGFTGELEGTYYPLTGMTNEVRQQLNDDHFLFKEGDHMPPCASRFWPTGRGIFHNLAKTFLVWCNEEDHLRIISMEMGGDLGSVYRRLIFGVGEIRKQLRFVHSNRLGFLTSYPTKLGSTIQASVYIKVPKLAANYRYLEEIATRYNLQVRGTRGKHMDEQGRIYEVYSKRRLGLTEFEAVKEMQDGIIELIKNVKSA